MGKTYSRQQMAQILLSAEGMIDESKTVKAICQHHKISRSTFYRWQAKIKQNKKQIGTARERALQNQLDDRDHQIAALRIAVEGNGFALNVVGKRCSEFKRNSVARSDRRAGL